MGLPELLLILAGLVGLAGTLLPFLPGAALIWVAAAFYAWWSGGSVISGRSLLILGVLALVAHAADFVFGAGGAKRFGATRRGVIGAALGTLCGVLVLGPIGIVVGPVAGALLGELTGGRPLQHAVRAGLGAGLGTLAGVVISFTMAVIMLGYIIWLVAAA